tara:strand:+ start:1674 stop:2075 length:402 start_codon:yes stop_codon:yes gene_type:complete
MTLIEQINRDFIIAYKAKELIKKDFIGLLKSEVTKESKIPEDTYIISKIKSMIKNAEATNSLTEFELNILNEYLPNQLSEEELGLIITICITTNGYSDINKMGKIMSWLKFNYIGQYDGKIASNLIKKMLTNA